MVSDPGGAPRSVHHSARSVPRCAARLADRVDHHSRIAAHHPRGAGAAVTEAIPVGVGDGGVGGIAPEHLGRVEQAVVVGVRVERIGGDRPATGHLVPIVASVVVGVPILGIGSQANFFSVGEAVSVRIRITHIADRVVILLTGGRGDDCADRPRRGDIRRRNVEEPLDEDVRVDKAVRPGTGDRDHRPVIHPVLVRVGVVDVRTQSITVTAKRSGKPAQSRPGINRIAAGTLHWIG